MQTKIISYQEALRHFCDEMTLMIAGFMANGSSERLIDAILEKGICDYTIICNDTAMPGFGISRLIDSKRVKKIITSHIGMNPETGRQMSAGELEVELVPQGTLAERIRCGGHGLGGVLTPTGLGTHVAEGKRILEVEGKEYLLETPLRADVAILHGTRIDSFGNVYYAGTTRNFNPLMAMAADLVLATAEEVVEIGTLEPECIMTSGIFVDYIVKGDS